MSAKFKETNIRYEELESDESFVKDVSARTVCGVCGVCVCMCVVCVCVCMDCV